MATGRQPFQGDTSAVGFAAILTQSPVSPRKLNPQLPNRLEHIINRALERDRVIRYQSAGEILGDFARAQESAHFECFSSHACIRTGSKTTSVHSGGAGCCSVAGHCWLGLYRDL
jgi:hypothetical protein